MAGEYDPVKGTVAWFDVRRGFGFIAPEDGGENLFVHQSSIKAMGFRSLSVGEAVEFVVSVGDHGRRRAVSVTGPGGAYIKGRRYFGGACYRCGEVGHMAMDCKSNGGCRMLGPCYSCGVMGHLAKECPAARIESSSPRSNMFKACKLSDHVEEESRTVFGRIYESMDSAEEEEEDEINDEDRELTSRVDQRNWAELPHDVLSVIFKKIAAVEILRSAQFVCRPWRQLSHEPEIWRHIVVAMPDDYMSRTHFESLVMLAADRSEGSLEKFHLEGYLSVKDEILGYIADRAPKLRCLRLISIPSISAIALAQAVEKFLLLEELEISFSFISAELLGSVGLACPQLKSFRRNTRPYDDDYYSDFYENFDAEALAIATHMQQLHRLQLIGNSLTNTGLFAILDNCPNLQYLDIRRCYNIKIDENLKKRCKAVTHLRLPKDSTAEYEFNEVIDGPEELAGDLSRAISYSYCDSLYGDFDYDYDLDGEISDTDYDDLFDFR